ncbi:AIM24 family protein [Paenibacillus silviterrae]|uniref:AIM24 family protein n=1 Tax=Paenibacillus silviterrae TaxID=3242194 RepID=UPI002542D31C|nr:AIM24 family protein [Paenibacillus chinjuensis]
MKVSAPQPTGHARIELSGGEALHVLHPGSILAYRGQPGHREDRWMDLGGAYRKRRWVRSVLTGPSEFLLGLPTGHSLISYELPADSSLLFDFRHVIYFTDGMSMKSKILKLKTAWISRELVRMKFSGPGTLGILAAGDAAVMELDPSQPLFVDKNALIAYPEDAFIHLSVYGNSLASQHMNVQWEIRGTGSVLVQSGSRDRQLEDRLSGDGWFKRLLREVLPFGSVYIK